jgi:hypothetical protein
MPDVSAWRKYIWFVAFEFIAPARRVRRMRTMAPAEKRRDRRANIGPASLVREDCRDSDKTEVGCKGLGSWGRCSNLGDAAGIARGIQYQDCR